MERARNRIRIRLANIFMALTALGCVIMVLSGKKAAERGETVRQMNMDWHKSFSADKSKEGYAKRFEEIATAGSEAQK